MVDRAPRTAGELLRRMLRRRRGLLLAGWPLICLWQLGETLVPVLIGLTIDRGVAPLDLGGFLLGCGLLAADVAMLSYAYRFGARLSMRAQQVEAHELRVEVARHALHPRGSTSGLLPGETLALATGDTTLTSQVLRQLGFAIASVVALVVVAVYLVAVDPVTALVVLVGAPVVVALTQLLTPLVARRTEAQQSAVAEASGLATDLVRGVRPLKGVGGEDVAVARYREASARARDASRAMATSWGFLNGLTTGASGLLLALVALLAGSRALSGELTVGELVAVVGLAQYLAEPITGLGDLSAQAAQSWASAGRLTRFLQSPPLLAVGAAEPAPTTRVALDAVSAGRLHDVDLHPRDGSVTAVVADDPADVEALLALLEGREVPRSGRVLLGDHDLVDTTMAARRASLAVSPHDPAVFEGTVRSVVDPDGTADPERLAAAVEAAAADDVVALHPDGLDREVLADGTSLSGGQRQRLSLARTLLADPPVVVLHDPTSAIDAVTERAVASGLRRLRARPGRATLVVTTSPALLDVADEVVVLLAGRVTARGRHADLLADPAYRELVLR
ncbi:MAG: ABC transporter ATP-binding protein [Aeromicrobium erythreum]